MNSLKDKYIYLFDINGIGVSRNTYEIIVDNSSVKSGNINIDRPAFYAFAFSKAEAIGIMILSDFEHKNKPVLEVREY